MKRVLGIIVLAVGVVGLVLSVAGGIYSYRFVDNMGRELATSLELTLQSLATVEDTLALSRTTVTQMSDTLGTVQDTADNVSTTISQTRPLIDQISDVTSKRAPDSIESLQQTIPNLVNVAGVIDNTLTTLSNLRVQRNLGLFNLDFDLGIDYDPEVPFDESIAEAGASLEGLPEQLRTLDIYMSVTSDNLQTVGMNVADLADDIATINTNVQELLPLLDEYSRIVDELQGTVGDLQSDIESQLQTVKIGLVIFFIWFALSQIVPLYLGWQLIAEGRVD